jgi:hypothetical protein
LRIIPSSYSDTWSTGRRSSGGVSMTLMSRAPLRDMCSVRGMGVAVRVSTSTSRRMLLELLLVAHAETLLLIDDQQPQVLERDIGLRAADGCR